jgi:hypothetical protein
MTVKKKKRLPYNYLEKYLNVTLSKPDYDFIAGCLNHQKHYFQLNNVQWEIIKKIEKKYLSLDG